MQSFGLIPFLLTIKEIKTQRNIAKHTDLDRVPFFSTRDAILLETWIIDFVVPVIGDGDVTNGIRVCRFGLCLLVPLWYI